MPTKIQSILFPRYKFTINSAKQWIKKNNYKNKKIDITNNYIRFRQITPKKNDKFRIKKLSNDVKLILLIY